MLAHLKHFEVQYVCIQRYDHPSCHVVFAHRFALFQAVLSDFQTG